MDDSFCCLCMDSSRMTGPRCIDRIIKEENKKAKVERSDEKDEPDRQSLAIRVLDFHIDGSFG